MGRVCSCCSGNHTGLPLRYKYRIGFGGSKPPPYDINIDYLYEESGGTKAPPYEKRLIFSGNHTGLPLRVLIRFISTTLPSLPSAKPPSLNRGGIGGVVFGGSKPPPYDYKYRLFV